MERPDLTVIEKFNPLAAIGREILGEEYKLDSEDYLELLKGTIGMIPVVGAFITSIFSVVWNRLFPVESPYLRKDDLIKRLNKLVVDMEKKMSKKIDDEIVKFCSKKFESLCAAGFGFSEIEYIFDKQKKDGKPVSDAVKTYISANHVTFRQLFIDCLIFFSREDKFELLVKLYLQTVVMYIAFLRDTHFNGIAWGLPEEYVNGVDHIKSMEAKIHETIELAHANYSKFFLKLNPLNDMRKEGTVGFDKNGLVVLAPPPTQISFPQQTQLCDFRPLLAQFTYCDLTRYKYNQVWLQFTNKQGRVMGDNPDPGYETPPPISPRDYQYRLTISNRIYIADFINMRVASGSYGPVEYGENSVNSVTGTKGLCSPQSHATFYMSFYFSGTKNLTFRLLANADLKAQIEMVIREIPEGKDPQNPDESKTMATKSHSETIAYKKLFESSSGPIGEFVSKQYKFEKCGSIYYEVKVVGGNTRKLLSLEIIDTARSNLTVIPIPMVINKFK